MTKLKKLGRLREDRIEIEKDIVREWEKLERFEKIRRICENKLTGDKSPSTKPSTTPENLHVFRERKDQDIDTRSPDKIT